MGAAEVEAFLSHLATTRNVSASTQNQAKAALLFLYKEVLGTALPWLDDITQAKASRRLPVVLTTREVKTLLDGLNGTMWLVASLLYGTGMRLLEALRLRIKDVEFEQREVVVREGKGNKNRVTVLPENLIIPLREQIALAKRLRDADLQDGYGSVEMPFDRALRPIHGSVIIAVVDGEFTCKRLHKRGGVIKLQAANPAFPDIVPADGQTIELWGVVTKVIKSLAK